MEVTLPETAFPAGAPRIEAVRRIVSSVRAVPGVDAAAVTTVNPLGGGTWGAAVASEDAAQRDPSAALNVNHRLITPRLLETMRIPILRGRSITADDRATTPAALIVSPR